MSGEDGNRGEGSLSAITPLTGAAASVLAPVNENDRWGRAVRERLSDPTVLTPAIGDVLILWSKATGTSPTKTWLRQDDELRDRLPDGQVTLLAEVLLTIFLGTTLPDDERDAAKKRHAAVYELLRTLRKERDAKRAGELQFLGREADGPVAAWEANVNPRIDALPGAVKQGELLGSENADLLRGAVWAAARYPPDPSATADLLAAVVVHGVDVNRGFEPCTEPVQAGKAVNAGIAMLATLNDCTGRTQLKNLQVSITNGHHTKQIDKALAALNAG